MHTASLHRAWLCLPNFIRDLRKPSGRSAAMTWLLIAILCWLSRIYNRDGATKPNRTPRLIPPAPTHCGQCKEARELCWDADSQKWFFAASLLLTPFCSSPLIFGEAVASGQTYWRGRTLTHVPCTWCRRIWYKQSKVLPLQRLKYYHRGSHINMASSRICHPEKRFSPPSATP